MPGVGCPSRQPADDDGIVVGMAVKLLDQVRQAIRMRHYSRRTEEAYVVWIRRYIVFHGKRHPTELGAPHIRDFLSSLATQRHVSASTQNQALCAVLFLYREVLRMDVGQVDGVVRASTPARVPVVLSRAEVSAILARLEGTVWLVVALLYGAGMRLQEALELRVKDIDFDRCGSWTRARAAAGRARSKVSQRRLAVGVAIRVPRGADLPGRAVGPAVPVSFARVGCSARRRGCGAEGTNSEEGQLSYVPAFVCDAPA
jgi:integrase